MKSGQKLLSVVFSLTDPWALNVISTLINLSSQNIKSNIMTIFIRDFHCLKIIKEKSEEIRNGMKSLFV